MAILIFFTDVLVRAAAPPADYTMPLWFDVKSSPVQWGPLQFVYVLNADKELKMGTLDLSAANFSIQIRSLEGTDLSVLMAKWPERLFQEPDLELRNWQGDPLWRLHLDRRARAQWKNGKSQAEEKLKTDSSIAVTLQESLFGIFPLSTDLEGALAGQSNLRFCLTEAAGTHRHSLCTPPIVIKKQKQGVESFFAKQPVESPRILLNQKPAALNGRVEVKAGEELQFFSSSKSGQIYEFFSIARQPDVREIYAKDKAVHIVGWGVQPLGVTKILNPPIKDFFERELRWEDTIGDFRVFWEHEVQTTALDQGLWSFVGEGGGIFTQKFTFQDLPQESDRGFLRADTTNFTYADKPRLFVWSPQGKQQIWFFKARSESELNTDSIPLGKYLGSYEIERGYAGEVSARLSGVATSTEDLVVLGEFAFAYWFENIFSGTRQDYGKDRWGIIAKYFQSLNELTIAGEAALFKILTVDLKYRFTPGLWGRHESWGLMSGLEQFEYTNYKADFLGIGFFWARSMPLIFDHFFSSLPFMNYPKWVDLEFIYYPTVLNSSGIHNNDPPEGMGNWALNFHGKVFWTKQFFGEAGFGLRQFDFTQQISESEEQQVQFAFIYGTVGLGWNF